MRNQLKQSNDLQFTNFGEIGERRFLGTNTSDLRWLHDESLLLARRHIRVLLPDDVEDSGQQLVVSVITLGSLPQALGVGFGHGLVVLFLGLLLKLSQPKAKLVSTLIVFKNESKQNLPRGAHSRLP